MGPKGSRSHQTFLLPILHLVAVWPVEEAVEAWDALTLKLLFTLQQQKVTTRFRRGLAYSQDGCSLARCSDTAIFIWDAEMGGLVKAIECKATASGLELVRSLDGKTIRIVLSHVLETITVPTYDVTSGATLCPDTPQSRDEPCLWARDKPFRIATTTASDRKGWTIDVFEVGSTITKTEPSLSPVNLSTESALTALGRPLDAFSPDGTHIATAQ